MHACVIARPDPQGPLGQEDSRSSWNFATAVSRFDGQAMMSLAPLLTRRARGDVLTAVEFRQAVAVKPRSGR